MSNLKKSESPFFVTAGNGTFSRGKPRHLLDHDVLVITKVKVRDKTIRIMT